MISAFLLSAKLAPEPDTLNLYTQLDDGPHGIVVTKTTQAFIVAKYSPPIQAGEATPVVEGLADYLSSVGY